MNLTRLAVIGTGLIGLRHLAAAQRNTNVTLVAACDTNPAGAQIAATYGIPFYQDYHRLLAVEDLDGVIIATPTNTHAPIGGACAQHGVHILIEKPITGTLEDARRLLAAAEEGGIHTLVGHHRRHNYVVQQARELIQNGTIGDLIGVTAMFALLKPLDYYNVTWRKKVGGGPILTNLIHDIDNLRFICGEIETVYAATSSKTRGFDVEDTAGLTLHFANGALGTVLVSDATPSPWSYELTSGENPVYPLSGQDCYQFCGTKASLAFPSMTLWRYPEQPMPGWYRPLEQVRRIDPKAEDPLDVQLTHFCEVIQDTAQPLISGVEGLKTLAATEAVLKSAQVQMPVSPASLW